MSKFAEILARAEACRTVAEIDALMTPEEIPSPGLEWDIFCAYKEHLLQAEVGAKAALCQTEEEAHALLQATDEEKDPQLKRAYYQRWVDLANVVAPAKAKACGTGAEAYELYAKVPDESWAEVIYQARWYELELAELAEKPITCTTTDEAQARYEKAGHDSPTEEFFLEIWVKLANAGAPAKALDCTTALEAWNLAEAAPAGSLAQAIYRARSEELSV